jgi:hypothetical protein
MKLIPEILNSIELGNQTIFRGHADFSWELKPSIGRHYSGDWGNVTEREQKALESFERRSVPHLRTKPSSKIEWLSLMQHHGCATRLLDFTTNPLIALFFASETLNKVDGALISAKYKNLYNPERADKLFEEQKNFVYHPPHITERIIGQSGCFVCCAKPNAPLDSKQCSTIRIKTSDKPQIREELKFLDVTYAALFPGIDGICRDLRDSLVNDLEIEDWC